MTNVKATGPYPHPDLAPKNYHPTTLHVAYRTEMEGLTGLSLSGFQVFHEVAHIPVRRLTLLFGPNSAGKSAFEDALLIVQELCCQATEGRPAQTAIPIPFDSNPRDRFPRLKRHWRQTSGAPTRTIDRMTISCAADTEVGIQGLLLGELEREHTESRPTHYSIELRFTFRREEDEEEDPDDPFVRRDIELLINGESALLMEEFARLGVNCKHPVIQPVNLGDAVNVVADRWPEFVTLECGWAWLHGGVRVDENKHLDEFYLRYQWEGHFEHHTENKPLRVVPPEVLQLLHELAVVHNALMDIVLRNVSPHFRADLVPASRTVPLDDQLAFLIGPFEDFNLDTHRAVEFEPLAASFLARQRQEQSSPSSHCDAELCENVNRMLTDYLFLERGYRIAIDYRLILSRDEDDTPEGALIRLFLMDAQGRKFSFTDVGSGLGYVLPVLVAVWKPFAEPVILQQPELHLHPALQAALGDVLIESSKNKKLIVETHSEHILLRVLKRIRQSHLNKEVPDGLNIEPDEVAVIYFDPSADGTTQVKRLRISRDGEFLDRWPHGFFSERDQELFDE